MLGSSIEGGDGPTNKWKNLLPLNLLITLVLVIRVLLVSQPVASAPQFFPPRQLRQIQALTEERDRETSENMALQQQLDELVARFEQQARENAIMTRSLIYKADDVGVETKLLYDVGEALEKFETTSVQLSKAEQDCADLHRENADLKGRLDQGRGCCFEGKAG